MRALFTTLLILSLTTLAARWHHNQLDSDVYKTELIKRLIKCAETS